MSELRYAQYVVDRYRPHTNQRLKEQGYWEHTTTIAHAMTDETGVYVLPAATEDDARKLIATLAQHPEKVAELKARALKQDDKARRSMRAYGHRH